MGDRAGAVVTAGDGSKGVRNLHLIYAGFDLIRLSDHTREGGRKGKK